MSIEDKAQEQEAAEWERRNAPRAATPMYTPEHPKYGPEACDQCEDAMPELRRAHGWRLCTACQTAIEQVRRR